MSDHTAKERALRVGVGGGEASQADRSGGRAGAGRVEIMKEILSCL